MQEMIREEFEYIAKGPAQGPARKLVVLLHGYGVHAGFMEKMADAVLKDIPDALVIAPHAPGRMDLPPEDERDELFVPAPDEAKEPPPGLEPDMQREWFAITRSPQEMHAALLELASRLNKFIDSKRDELGIGEQDIAVMGFSQGGALAFYTACTRDEPVGCVVGHSTIVVDTKDFTAKPPALLVYGTADNAFSIQDYESHSIRPLKSYLTDFETEKVEKLGHTTNAASRKIVSFYIKRKLSGPA